jgi:hypothetical protein
MIIIMMLCSSLSSAVVQYDRVGTRGFRFEDSRLIEENVFAGCEDVSRHRDVKSNNNASDIKPEELTMRFTRRLTWTDTPNSPQDMATMMDMGSGGRSAPFPTLSATQNDPVCCIAGEQVGQI